MSNIVIPHEITCKSALNKTGIPGYDYCLNPYVGCTHGCIYCYASFMCRFTGHKEKWSEFLDVKINIAEVLVKQLHGRKLPRGKVLFGTVTDAYQPAESNYRLTRSCLELLADYQRLEVGILTKSALAKRDIDLFRRIPVCEVGFSITTLDSRISRLLEPGASAPRNRLEAAGRIEDAGIPVWVFIAPLLPGITDSEAGLLSLLNALQDKGIKEVWVDRLNPYPAVINRLKTMYRQYFPHSLRELEEYVRYPDNYENLLYERLRQINARVGCKAKYIQE